MNRRLRVRRFCVRDSAFPCIDFKTPAFPMNRAMNNFGAGIQRYSVRHLDSAIEDLEQVLSPEGANSLFSKTYWRGRVVQALSTPGLAPSQHSRLQRLLDRIAHA
jgi:hypothetical protein